MQPGRRELCRPGLLERGPRLRRKPGTEHPALTSLLPSCLVVAVGRSLLAASMWAAIQGTE